MHVKAIVNSAFKSGETDLRFVYIADALNGTATVIARDEQNR